jgi:succinate dehydrogenase / fumarate reductase, cytochrome b subunit
MSSKCIFGRFIISTNLKKENNIRMNWFRKALSGSIGQKLIMAITGLFLVTFLLEHLLGNLLLLYHDPTIYNGYAEFMGNNPVIKAAEFVLFAGFIFHIVYAAVITAKNKKARPQDYAYSKPGENSSWFSRNMGLTGLLVFLFLALHLWSFFFPHKIFHTAEVSLHEDAWAKFSQPGYVVIYVTAMFLLGLHLNHGFQSAFQTLGLRHSKYTPFIKSLGTWFAILVPAGFALIPIYILIQTLS